MTNHEFRYLVTIDGSLHMEEVMKAAVSMAKCSSVYDMALVHVVESNTRSMVVDDRAQQAEARGNRILNNALERLGSEGVTASAHLLHGIPADTILEFADTYSPDMILVGSRGTGTMRSALLGSVSTVVARQAKSSVLVVR